MDAEHSENKKRFKNEPDEAPWIPDEQIEACVMERQVYPTKTPMDHAKEILENSLPLAAQAVAHMAVHSGNENTRLRAAQYIIDRNMGRIGDPEKVGSDDLLMSFLQGIENEVNAQHASRDARDAESEAAN
jgi:hypothetical protein